MIRPLALLLVIVSASACTLYSLRPCTQSDDPVLDATFTTMGVLVSLSGNKPSEWYWQQWRVVIDPSGCVHQHVQTNNHHEDRYYTLHPAEMRRLLRYVDSHLQDLPDQVGTTSFDADFATIHVSFDGHSESVALEGGGYSAPAWQRKAFYRVIDRLLAKFPVSLS